jgi:hypothetical protein
MICPICKQDKENLIKIFLKDKSNKKSDQVDVCVDCEGEMERPFVVYIKSKLARAFIQTVKSQGGFVKDAMVKMMKDFVEKG